MRNPILVNPTVVMGDVVTDIVVRPHAQVTPDSDTTASIHQALGGAGANVAAWLSWSGVPVRLVGRVGDDPMGAAHASRLRALGVDVRLTADRERPTGTVVVFVDENGQRTMYPDRAANAALSEHHLAREDFVGVGHLHLSGYVLLDPQSRPAARAALEIAREAGISVSVDPSSVAPLKGAGVGAFLRWTRGTAVCLPNAAEAQVLSGIPDLHASAMVLGRHYGEVVVTTGGGDALWSDGTSITAVAAQPVVVRDTTGAGDAFAAGFLSARLAGASVEAALRSGHRAGAAASSVIGAQPDSAKPKLGATEVRVSRP